MRLQFYKYIYSLLLIISNRFNNPYINRYKLFIGTTFLLTVSGCEEAKKKNKETIDHVQITNKIKTKKLNEDSLVSCMTTEVEEIPVKPKRGRRNKKTVTDTIEEIQFIPYIEGVEEVEVEDIICYIAIVDNMPEFPGGMKELKRFLAINLKYPASCKEENIEGKIIAQFTVNKDGSICDIEILKSSSPLFNNEVIRVIRMMPMWIPGKANGRPGRVRYTLPVTFKIQ